MNLFNKECFWLLDTGASISAVRSQAISEFVEVHCDNIVINGIGGKIYSKGYVYLDLQLHDGSIYQHKFYLFDKLPCKGDGIIGLDFLTKYNTNIDLENSYLRLKHLNTNCDLPIFTSPKVSTTYITIPARSESIHYIQLKKKVTEDCVIYPKELQENIFLAGLIVQPKNNVIPIQILNTSEQSISMPIFEPDIHPLKDYKICTFSKTNTNAERARTLLQLLKLDHLHSSERSSIASLCSKYSDIFHLPGDKLTTTDIYEQSIHLKPNTNPVYVKPYRTPNSLKPEIDKQIRKLLEDDIIEEASSEWSSPILLVPKKATETGNKNWRLVIDYRKLNEQIQDDRFPLPNIVEILDSLSGAVYFSHLDLSNSYYQVILSEDSRKVTSFCTNAGQYQMKRLPMGLKISPSSFSRIMTIAMSGLNLDKCFIYLDDLVVFGRSIELHNKNLTDVFERLRKVNLKLNPKKCNFLQTELLYLGHVVSNKGVSPDPEKIKIIKEYPVPKNADELRRFVAFCNYYRKFIDKFADITIPLNNLLRKNVPYIWTAECVQSFEILKNALVSPPILQYPDFSNKNEFILQTDASNISVGAVLCNKNMRPVAYSSRPLNKAEKNYPTIQKELVAIVWGVKYFRPYLFGKKFTIMTDHKPLLYLFGMKDPSSRLLKFRLALEEYDFNITYIKGKDNVVADALSRITITSDELKEINEKSMIVMTRGQKLREQERIEREKNKELVIPSKATDERCDQPRIVEILRIPNSSVEMTFVKGNEIKQLKKHKDIIEDECFMFVPSKHIIYINHDYHSQFTRAEFVKKLCDFCKSIKVNEICLIKKEENALFIKQLLNEVNTSTKYEGPIIHILRGIKRVEMQDEKEFILNDYHLLPTAGHAGVRRMINNIRRSFYWPELERDVRQFIQKCEKCQKMKYGRNTIQPMVVTTTATSAFEKIFLDIVGPLDKDLEGNSYILSIQCDLSKFVEVYPLPNKESKTVARALVNNFILRFGIPNTILTDRGTEFMSSTMTEVCKLLGIEKLNSTSYHHQTIGSLENSHKHLGAYLRTQCDKYPEAWSHWLPYWSFTYNNTVHTITKYTPHELVFGKPSNIPCRVSATVEPLYNPNDYCLELKYRLQLACKDARENVIKNKQLKKCSYDKKIYPVMYKNGDKLLIRNENASKLDQLFEGPYTVIEDLEPNVKIDKNGKIDVVHKNRTKLYT